MSGTSSIISLPNFAGIDFNAILQSIVATSQIPISAQQQAIALDQAALSGLGSLSADLTSLQSAIDNLKRLSNDQPLAVSVSAGAPFTASLSGSALRGSYSVSVQQMASSQSSASQGYASQESDIGTGTVTIVVGGVSHQITIDSSHNTLSALADAINGADVGVFAQVVNTGLPSSPFRLVLASLETGSAGAFSVQTNLTGGVAPDFSSTAIGPVDYSGISGTANSQSNGPVIGGVYSGSVTQGFTFTVESGGAVGSSDIVMRYNSDSGESGTITIPSGYAGEQLAIADGLTMSFAVPGGTFNSGDSFSVGVFNPHIAFAQDAKVRVGNQIITSSSNEVSGAIPGVKLSLLGVGAGSLSVSDDQSTSRQILQDFTKAFNRLVSDIDAQTRPATPGGSAPPLNANGVVQALEFALKSALGGINLSKIGISIDGNQVQDNNGQLVLDFESYQNNFQSDPSGTANVINGVAQALIGIVNSALDPVSGLIATQKSAFNDAIDRANREISRLTDSQQRQVAMFQQEAALIQAEIEKQVNIAQIFLNQGNSNSGGSLSQLA